MANNCPKCNKKTDFEAKFCPYCGWEMAKPYFQTKIKAKHVVVLLVLAFLLWSFSWTTQKQLAGEKPVNPTVASVPGVHPAVHPKHNDPQIRQLYAELEKNPKDITKLRSLAKLLAHQMEQSPQASTEQIMETISILKRILDQDPSDAESLLALANISFVSNVFDKALEYYAKYLQVRPDHHEVRAQYASILTVVNRTDEAIAELERVLEHSADNYHALVYLAVAYFKKGDKTKFNTFRDQALAAASSDNEKAAIKDYLDSLTQSRAKDTHAETPPIH